MDTGDAARPMDAVDMPNDVVSADDGAHDDAAAAADGGADDGGDLLSHCTGSRDVYYRQVVPPPGSLTTVEYTSTNLGSSWYVYASQAGIALDVGGSAASLDFGTIVPGTYPQGSSAGGPDLQIAEGGEACSVTSGSVTLDQIEYDADGGTAAGNVTSLLLSYDVVCGGNTVRGCARYSANDSTASDASTPLGWDAAASLEPGTPLPVLAAACLDAGYAIYVNGTGAADVSGLAGVTGASGEWSASITGGSYLQMDVETSSPWAIAISSQTILTAGTTYETSSSTYPYIQIEANGSAVCPSADLTPRGSFRIEQLTDTGGDQANVEQLLVSFDLTCPDGGTVTGCAHYGN